MKRFFKPIEKDGSAKKPALEQQQQQQQDQSAAKLDGTAESGVGLSNQTNQPLKFVTWNANSFLLRVKNNWPEFSNLVSRIDPDVIAVQEVRMPAAGSKGAPKNPGEIKDDTSSSREEKQGACWHSSTLSTESNGRLGIFQVDRLSRFISRILMRALSSPPFRDYRVWWSLGDTKYAGTALLVKKCCHPLKVSFSLDRTGSKHEPDGRVILAEFETFRLLNTYAPNNGWKEEENAFQRRRKWDKRMLDFVLQASDKPLIWCGDLNVSLEDIDVSHPEFFSTAKLNGYVPPNEEDCGQPGFTLNERKRFGTLLKEGKLTDAYRFLHKDKDMDHGFSWSGNPIGKYRGKRMRIDYFLVSEKLRDRIVSCEMHGQGIELEGFYGSDHCPVSLQLSPITSDANGS